MAKAMKDNLSLVKIIGLHHIGIPVNNLERAIDYYTQVLGMKLKIINRAANSRGHFIAGNLPNNVEDENEAGEFDYQEYARKHEQIRGHEPTTDFARLSAGNIDVVLFERPVPNDDETLISNGIFHQSFHVSNDDFERLLTMKAAKDTRINIHTGPVMRWPHGRAMYIWDSEGNYLELETEEDLPLKFGLHSGAT